MSLSLLFDFNCLKTQSQLVTSGKQKSQEKCCCQLEKNLIQCLTTTSRAGIIGT